MSSFKHIYTHNTQPPTSTYHSPHIHCIIWSHTARYLIIIIIIIKNNYFNSWKVQQKKNKTSVHEYHDFPFSEYTLKNLLQIIQT